MNSDDVPQKFSDWLLSMGCPIEDMPSIEKMKQMCRGHYDMVWCHMMQRVQSKQVIREKRLQVFCDDLQLNNVPNAFGYRKKETYVPEQLALWRQYNDLKQKVNQVENRVRDAKQELSHVIEKVSIKKSLCNSTSRRSQDAQRRAWLLRALSAQLTERRDTLLRTRDIAETLKPARDAEREVDIDKCLSLLSKAAHANKPADSASVLSVNSDGGSQAEEQLNLLMSSAGGSLWLQLVNRRGSLVEKLSMANSQASQTIDNHCYRESKAVLVQSNALFALLGLDAIKNNSQIKNMQKGLEEMMNLEEAKEKRMSPEARELLVLRCERARAEARVASMRAQLDSLTNGTGVFRVEGGGGTAASPDVTRRRILKMHRDMESKGEDVKRLVAALSKYESKILHVKENLQMIFKSFQKDLQSSENESPTHTEESQDIASVRTFYEQRLKLRQPKLNLSMDLDMSFTDNEATSPLPSFVDELKLYLNKFKLEKNRKLVLDNGDTLWVFERLQELCNDLYAKCEVEKLAGVPILPFVSVTTNLTWLVESITTKRLQLFANRLATRHKQQVVPDITPRIIDAEKSLDTTRKRLSENLSLLDRIVKMLDLARSNLNFWEQNQLGKHISDDRTVDGKTYLEYEKLFNECCKL